MSAETPLEIAIQRVKDKFKRPGSLENIDSIIEDSKQRNIRLKNQISSLSTDIVIQIRNAMIHLEESHKCMEDIKKGVSQVNERCAESGKIIDDYPKIKTINHTRNNIDKTYTSLKVFKNLDSKYDILECVFIQEWKNLRVIVPKNIDLEIPSKYDPENEKEGEEEHGSDDDRERYLGDGDDGERKKKRRDYDVSDMNMLTILQQLDHLQTLKIQAKVELKKNHSKQLDIINSSLKRSRQLSTDFELLFRRYTRHILDYCMNHGDVIQQLVDCINYQERKDRINERQLGKNSRLIKLKEIFFNEMKRSIESEFDFEGGRMASPVKSTPVLTDIDDEEVKEKDLNDQLKEIENLVNNLQYMEKNVGSKFPKKYKVTEFYIRTTYVSTIVWLKLKVTQQNNEEMNEKEIGNDDKLRLYKWIKEVYPEIFRPYKEKKYVKIETLNSLLESLVDSYIGASSRILQDCTKRLIKDIFSPNMKPLQVGEDDPIYSPGPKEMFDMVANYMQQVVEYKLADVLGRVLLNVQDMIMNYSYEVVDEVEKMAEDPAIEIIRFVPYINDFSNLILHLREKREQIIDTGILEYPGPDEKWISWMDRKLPQFLEDRADECLAMMKKTLFKQIHMYMKELFGPNWVSGRPVTQAIVSHMANFLDDLEDLEVDYREEIYLERHVVKEYLRRLYFTSRKFGKKDIEVLIQDVKIIKQELSGRNLKAIEFSMELMTTDEEDSYSILLGKVIKKFPDFRKHYLVKLIEKSSVIKKKAKVMSVVEAFFPEEEMGRKKLGRETLFSEIDYEKHPGKDKF